MGTDPTNSASHLHFMVATSNGAPVLSCSTVPGRTYIIEYTESLTAPVWQPLVRFAGTGETERYSDTAGTAGRYSRMRVVDVDVGAAWPWLVDTDTDHDSLPNDWELAFFGSATGAVAGLDSDGDRYSNWAEFVMGTDPTNAVSQLNFAVASSNAVPKVSCSTVVGRTYYAEYTESLTTPDWQPLSTFAGTGLPAWVADPGAAATRYYRMRVVR
jgi:hypothetical protein